MSDAMDELRTDAAEANGSLLALIDRLTALLERSDLVELEVQSGGTGLVLRKPGGLSPALGDPAPAGPPAAAGGDLLGGAPSAEDGAEGLAQGARAAVGVRVVRAPLTGIFYAAPSPGSPPYISVGGEVAVGQVIGLIEAMKLFNEIKSDHAGRVARVVVESGSLVKAKQPLIEVEPL